MMMPNLMFSTYHNSFLALLNEGLGSYQREVAILLNVKYYGFTNSIPLEI